MSAGTVLVVGGAGYIGSHVLKALAAAGRRVVTLDNLVHGHREAVKWGEFVLGDVGDQALLRLVFTRFRPSAVMHFSAHAYVGESVGDPGKYYANNLANGLRLLETMREFDCRRLVFSSTCATYGLPLRVPLDEEHPQNPVNPYGRTKLALEWAIRDFADAYGLRFAILRYFNAAGADAEGELGEEHQPETHLIPLVLEAAAGLRESVRIYGTDYDTPDGTCVRDYVHVSDLAEAHVLALRRLAEGGGSLACNLGIGRGYSVREVVAGAEAVTGRKIRTDDADRRLGDPPILVGSVERSRTELGWRPKYGDLSGIITTAWNWHKRKWRIA